jgi:hypothetical protein
MMLTLDGRVAIPDVVVFRELDGEAVLLNLESGIYFGLDEVGTRIWQLAEEHRSLRRVWEALQSEYDVPAATLETDLLRFVGQLLAKGLVTVAPENLT